MSFRRPALTLVRSLSFALLVLGVQGCVAELGITDGPQQVAVVVRILPAFDPLLANTVASTRISEMDLVVRDAISGETLAENRVPRDPDATDTALELRVEIEEETTLTIEGTLRLMGEDGTVEWSATFGPATVTSIEEVQEFAVDMGRGDLANLSVSALSLAGLEAEMVEGVDGLLTAVATGHPSPTLFWNSTNPAVLTIDGTGRVVALAPGETEVSVVAGHGASVRTIQVHQRTVSLEIAPTEFTFPSPGGERAFTATALDPRGNAVLGRTPQWSSSDSEVVVHLGNGLFRATGAGEALVLVEMDGISATAEILVAGAVDRIVVVPLSVSFANLGAPTRITATALDVLDAPVADATFTWESSNPAVATVDGTGVVTAVGIGSATITVRSSGKSAAIPVSVAQVPSTLTVEPEEVVLPEVGDTEKLDATVKDAAGFDIVGAAVVWSSANPDVATVDGTGLVTAVAPGTVEVTATAGSATGTASITVLEPEEEVALLIQAFVVIPILHPDVVVPGSEHRFVVEVENLSDGSSPPHELIIDLFDEATEERLEQVHTMWIEPIEGEGSLTLEGSFILPGSLDIEAVRFEARLIPAEEEFPAISGSLSVADLASVLDPKPAGSDFLTHPYTVFYPHPEAFLTCVPGYRRVPFFQPFAVDEFAADGLERVDLFVESENEGPWYLELLISVPSLETSRSAFLSGVVLPTEGPGGTRISFELLDGGLSGLEGRTVYFYPWASTSLPGISADGLSPTAPEEDQLYYLGAGTPDCPAILEFATDDVFAPLVVTEFDGPLSPAIELFEGEAGSADEVTLTIGFIGSGGGEGTIPAIDALCASGETCTFTFPEESEPTLNFYPGEGSNYCGTFGTDPNDILGVGTSLMIHMSEDRTVKVCFDSQDEAFLGVDPSQFEGAESIAVGTRIWHFRGTATGFGNVSRNVAVAVAGSPLTILDGSNAMGLEPDAYITLNLTAGFYLGIAEPSLYTVRVFGFDNETPTTVSLEVLSAAGEVLYTLESFILNGRLEVNLTGPGLVRLRNKGESRFNFRPFLTVPAPEPPPTATFTVGFLGTGQGQFAVVGEDVFCSTGSVCPFEFPIGSDFHWGPTASEGSGYCGIYDVNPNHIVPTGETFHDPLLGDRSIRVCFDRLSDAVLSVPNVAGALGTTPLPVGTYFFPVSGVAPGIGNISRSLQVSVGGSPLEIDAGQNAFRLVQGAHVYVNLTSSSTVGIGPASNAVLRIDGVPANSVPVLMNFQVFPRSGGTPFIVSQMVRNGRIDLNISDASAVIIMNQGTAPFSFRPSMRMINPTPPGPPPSVTLGIGPLGTGAAGLEVNPGGGVCAIGAFCEFVYPQGTLVTLDALPGSGSSICGFYDGFPNNFLSAADPFSFILNGDRMIHLCSELTSRAGLGVDFGPIEGSSLAIGPHNLSFFGHAPGIGSVSRLVPIVVSGSPLGISAGSETLQLGVSGQILLNLTNRSFLGIPSPTFFDFQIRGIGNSSPIPLFVEVLDGEGDVLSSFVTTIQNGRHHLNASSQNQVRMTNQGTIPFHFGPQLNVLDPVEPGPPVVQLISVGLSVPVTTFSATAVDPAGGDLSYEWSLVPLTLHEACGTPTAPWTRTGPSTTWSHSSSAPDSCAHEGTDHNVETTLKVTSLHTGKAVECTIAGTNPQTIANPTCTSLGGGAGGPFDGATWVGGVDGDWSRPGNWLPPMLPESATDILIPAGSTFFPTLSGDVLVGDLTVQNGAAFDLDGRQLTVSGDLRAGSPIVDGMVVMTGANTQLFGTLPNLVVDGGASVTPIGNVTVVGGLSIEDSSILAAGPFPTLVGGDLLVTSGSRLLMQNPGSMLTVFGNATFQARDMGDGDLTAGTFVLLGNLTAGGGWGQAFRATGTHTTRFVGEETQTINFAYPTDGQSRFQRLEVMKPGGELILATNAVVRGTVNVTGASTISGAERTLFVGGQLVSDPGSSLSGLGTIEVYQPGATFPLIRGSAPGLVLLQSGGTIAAPAGHTLLPGNLALAGTNTLLALGANALTVGGDLSVVADARFLMVNASAQLTVQGNATFNARDMGDGDLTAGLLTLHGNLDAFESGWGQAFRATGTHTTRFAGTGAQSVRFAFASDGQSRFQNLEVMKPSSTLTLSSNVVVRGALNVSAGSTIVPAGPGPTIFVGGPFTSASGSSLSGVGTLEVYVPGPHFPVIHGSAPGQVIFNLASNGSIVAPNGATTLPTNLTVSGSNTTFDLGPNAVTVTGNLLVDAGSRVLMQNPATAFTVQGNATFQARDMGDGELTAGLLSLHGNLTAGGGWGQAFRATGTHTTRFVGTGAQSVTFTYPTDGQSRFQNLDVMKSGSTLTLATNAVARGAVNVTAGSTILGGGRTFYVGGLLTSGSGSSLSGLGTLEVYLSGSTFPRILGSGPGSVVFQSNGTISAPPGTTTLPSHLTVAGSNTVLDLGANAVVLTGNLTLTSDARFLMQNSSAQMTVGGNATFQARDMGSGDLTAGTLLLHGNLAAGGGWGQAFRAVGSHVTKFAGTGTQTVSFQYSGDGQSQFQNVEVTNTSVGGVSLLSSARAGGNFFQLGRFTVPSPFSQTIVGTLHAGPTSTTTVAGTLTRGACVLVAGSPGATLIGLTCP